MNGFGNRLRELRLAIGLSQEKLADQLQSTVKSIQRYEKGYRPDTYALVKIATYFNVSTDYLLGLKSYKEMIKERKEKLKGQGRYNRLYSRYINCINNYEIMDDAKYYWIQLEDDYIGGQTEWSGWLNEECTLEIRRLRSVKPREAIKMCTHVNGKPMVINSQIDATIFEIYGGQAIIRDDICEKYLPQFMNDYTELNPEFEIFEQ